MTRLAGNDLAARAGLEEPAHAPPPLLLGAAALAWGAIADLALLGLLAACAIEAHRWIRWRWDFSDEDYVRVWNVCVALFLCVALFNALDGRIWAMARTFQRWMPVLLLPMMLAQVYGTRDSVPLVTFSLVARRKRELDVRLGREVAPARRFHFGHVYLATVIMALGVERVDHQGVFLASAVLVLWALWPLAPAGRSRIWWGIVALLMLGLGYLGQRGLEGLQRLVENRAMQWMHQYRSSHVERSVTQMGEVGEVQQSADIVWRMKKVTGPHPRNLRENTYQRYGLGMWRGPMQSFQDVPLRNQRDGTDWEVAPLPDGLERRAVTLRGRLRRMNEALPLPPLVSRLIDLEVAELRRNALGTFTATAELPTLDFLVVYDADVPRVRDAPPDPRQDLEVPRDEQPGLQRALDRMALPQGAGGLEVLRRVRDWFREEGFRYTRYLEGPRVRGPKNTVVTRFLEETRAGHCEYYASAAALLLRQAGVPARYVVGFAVREYDPRREEFVLRGIHGHAWVLAWVDGDWMEVDVTPAGWLEAEQAAVSRWQFLRDFLDRCSVDFDLWKESEEKGLIWSLLPLLIAGVLLGIVLVRFLRGFRRRRSPAFPGRGGVAIERLGLDSEWFVAEKALQRLAEARSPGETVAAWSRRPGMLPGELAADVEDAVRLHYRHRFDPAGLGSAERARLEELCRSLARRAEALRLAGR